MTADDIIAANPQFSYRPVTEDGMDALVYINEEGHDRIVIWTPRSDLHACGPYPISPETFRALRENLMRAERHVRRGGSIE